MIPLFIFGVLLAAAIFDYRSETIPNCCPVFILLFSLFAENRPPIWQAVLSMLSVFFLLYLMDYVCKQEVLGGRDLKLAAAFAFYAGWLPTLIGLEIACVLAWGYRKIRRYQKERFPFAPYLLVGFGAVLFFSMI